MENVEVTETEETQVKEMLALYKLVYKTKAHYTAAQSAPFCKWVKDTKQSNLTGGQATFAEWLISNKENVTKLGVSEEVFISVRKFLKENQ
jgi:hypothetical protein